MNASSTELANRLAKARADQQLVDGVAFESIASLAEAYTIQSMAIDQYPSAQIGYKVGATNDAVQKMFGADSPFFGPMFERECYLQHPDEAQQSPKMTLLPGVLGGEAEFAFVCGEDFPTDNKLSKDELPDLLQSCQIAVEIVGRRTLGEGLPTLHSAVADFGANVAFIEGSAIDNWKSIDLADVVVTASTNGEQTNTGTGSVVLGNPLNSLLWLHNALLEQGKSLRRGDRVSTGTCLGVIAATAGSTVDIEFEGCGKIGYQFV